MPVRIVHYTDLEGVYDDPARVAQVAGYVERFRTEDTLLVGTGDNTGPSVLSLQLKGRQAIDLFRRLEPDIDIAGNHDFDHGVDAFRQIIRQSPQTWLTTNIFEKRSHFESDTGAKLQLTADVDGTRVGFFGLTDPETPDFLPAAEPLRFSDPVEAANDAIARLESKGVDHVVGLCHLDDTVSLAEETNADLLLCGHNHETFVTDVDGTRLVQSVGQGNELVVVDIGTEIDVDVVAVDNQSVDVETFVTFRRYLDQLGMNETITTVNEPIERPDKNHLGLSRIGCFVADAYRWAADADIGLLQNGAIRAGPPLQGDVVRMELISILPFEDSLLVAELTGSELMDLIRESDGRNFSSTEPNAWFSNFSGLRIAWDHSSSKLVDAQLRAGPIDPDCRYSLATTDYIVDSDIFTAVTRDHVQAELGRHHEAIIRYAEEQGINPIMNGRFTAVGIN